MKPTPWLVAGLFLLPSLHAGEAPAMTAVVERKDISIEVELPGSFQTEDSKEISVEPERYRGSLIVTKILAEGTQVKTGDILMELDPKDLDTEIEKAKDAAKDAELELARARANREIKEIESKTALSKADLQVAFSETDLKKYLEDAADEIEKMKRDLKMKEDGLKDAEANTKQLKRLYDEREVYEENEKILMDREERGLDNQRKDLEVLARQQERRRRLEMPVEEQKKRLDLEEKQSERQKTHLKFKSEVDEEAAKMAKAERALQQANENVELLQKDRASLKVAAPRDGVLLYGPADSGNPMTHIISLGGGGNELHVGGRIKTHNVLFTLASMKSLSVKMGAQEADIQHIREGLEISVRPDAYPDLELKGKIVMVDQVAKQAGFSFSGGPKTFEIKAAYEGTYPQLRSGMNCRVTIHADRIPAALQVPVVAVFEEEGKYFCFVAAPSGPERRGVEIGITNGKVVEIKSGLREGESVSLKNPLEP